MRKFVFVAVALLAAGSSPVFAESTADAVKAWVTAIDATPEWSARYGTLTDDADQGLAIITGLAIHAEHEGGIRFDFDKVTLKGISTNVDGPFAADEIAIDHGTIGAAPFGFTLDDVTLTGLALPVLKSSDIDPDKPLAAFSAINELFSGFRLDRARIGRVANNRGAVGESTEIVCQDFALDRLANGRLDLFAAGPVRVASLSDEGPFRTTTDRIELRGIDLQAVLNAFDPERGAEEGDDSWRRVLSLVTYRGMVVDSPDSKVKVDDISLEDLRVRRPPPGYADTVRRMASDEALTDLERETLNSDLGLDILSSLSVGRLSLRNLDATGPEVDRVRLGGFAIRDVSLASIGEISLDDLMVTVPDQGTFSLDRFAIGGIVLPKLQAIRAAARAEKDGTEVDPVSLLPQLAFMEFLGARGLFPDKPPGSLDRLRFELGDYVGSIPTSASADLRGLEIPIDVITDEDARSLLKGLGLEHISIDYGYRVRWREADERLIVDDIHLDIEDVGSVSVNLVLSGLQRKMLEEQYEPERILQTLFFQEARIVFEDRSVTDRAIRYLAEKNDADPEVLRQETADAIPLTLRVAINNEDLRAKVAPALKAFLLKPGRLTLTARAKEPLSLAHLMEVVGAAPDSLSDLLVIDISQE